MATIGVLVSCHTPRLKNGMLQRCLNSVLAQERIPDQIAIAIDQEGMGAAHTKNRALEMLQTDWVAVIDSDDEMLPHHIRIHEEASLNTNADLIYSWFVGSDPFPPHFYSSPWDDEFPRHTTTTVMCRRDMMLKVKYTADPNSNAIYEDDDWRMTLGLIALGAKVHHIVDKSWVWHNDHSESTSGLAKNWRRNV